MTLHDDAVRAALNGESPVDIRRTDRILDQDAGPQDRLAELHGRVYTLDQLSALPPVEYLVPGVLPRRGLGFLYGASGHGKSFVAADIGLSLTSGIAYAGRPTAQVDVLYVPAEGASGFRKRVGAWTLHNPHGDPGDRFKVLPESINLGNPNGVDAGYIADIARFHGSQVVIFDTLARSMTGYDENNAKDMGVFIANAERVARAIDGLVIAVHHTGKDTTKGMRGSSAAFGGADVVIECSRTENEVVLKNPKMKDEAEFAPLRFLLVPKGPSLALEFQDGLYVPPVQRELVGQVLRLVRRLDDGTGVPGTVLKDAYMEATGRGKSDYYEVKAEAVNRALLRNMGSDNQPRFTLTDTGDGWLETHETPQSQ
jgi:hypothetical protein